MCVSPDAVLSYWDPKGGNIEASLGPGQLAVFDEGGSEATLRDVLS